MPSVRWSFVVCATETTEIVALSLPDALPISHGHRHAVRAVAALEPIADEQWRRRGRRARRRGRRGGQLPAGRAVPPAGRGRSEEHTAELQARQYLVCRLLLEKKKQYKSICRT